MEPASPQAVIGFIVIVILLLWWACYELTKTTKDFQDKPPYPQLNIFQDEGFHQHDFEIPTARSESASTHPQPDLRRRPNIPIRVIRDLYKATHHVQGGVREGYGTVYAVVPEGKDAADCDCATERGPAISRKGAERSAERADAAGEQPVSGPDKTTGGIRGFT